MIKAKIMEGYEYLRLMISGTLIATLIIILLGLHLHNLGNEQCNYHCPNHDKIMKLTNP